MSSLIRLRNSPITVRVLLETVLSAIIHSFQSDNCCVIDIVNSISTPFGFCLAQATSLLFFSFFRFHETITMCLSLFYIAMIIMYGSFMCVEWMRRLPTTNVSAHWLSKAKHMIIIIKAISMRVSLVRPFFFLSLCLRFYLFSEIVSKLKASFSLSLSNYTNTLRRRPMRCHHS